MPTLSIRFNTNAEISNNGMAGADSNQDVHFRIPIPYIPHQATFTLRHVFINATSFGTNRRSGLWMGLRFPQFPTNHIVSNVSGEAIDSALRFPVNHLTRSADAILDNSANSTEFGATRVLTGQHSPNINLGTFTLDEGYLHVVMTFRDYYGMKAEVGPLRLYNYFRNSSIILEYN